MASPLTNREYAYVSITGPGRHEDVTAALQLRPSKAWNVGDPNPLNGKPLRSMRWQHDSDLDDTHALAEHLAALFTVLGSRTNELRALWLDHDLTLTCVGHYPSWTHGLYLDREVVRQAASLGLALDLDFYFVRDHEEEPRATLPSGS